MRIHNTFGKSHELGVIVNVLGENTSGLFLDHQMQILKLEFIARWALVIPFKKFNNHRITVYKLAFPVFPVYSQTLCLNQVKN